MDTQAHPKTCSPTSSQIYIQTLLYPLLVYQTVLPLPFSKPISCHLTQGDLFKSHLTTPPSSSHPESNLCAWLEITFSVLCFCGRWGLFFFTTAFIPVLLRCLHTVCEVTGWLVIVWSALDTWTAVSAFPEVISLTAWWILAGESLTG